MITVRLSKDRGYFDHGWLKTYHTFSFGDYRDSQHNHFRNLRVINQDIVQTGTGFDAHSHENMEIITYIIRGEITHRDSMGNKKTIATNEIQCMSAGTGVTHSEHNESNEELELLQIWVFPDTKNLTPNYQQINFTPPENNLLPLTVNIHQDVNIYTGRLNANHKLAFELKSNRYAWLQLISGKLLLNHTELNPGDGAAISNEQTLSLLAKENAHFLLFDLT